MGLFPSNRKLAAAASSMHQFCPAVRSIFGAEVPDAVVEAATVYLYEHLAREIFGTRFAQRLRESIRTRYRFAPPLEIETRVQRIAYHAEVFRRSTDAIPAISAHDAFTRHVRSAIRALLVEIDAPYDDAELIRAIFPRFEEAVRRLKNHLVGIKKQCTYVMR